MTQPELYECMNKYIALWKTTIQGESHRDAVMKIWVERGFLDLDKGLFIKALYHYEDTAEKNYVAPRPKQILDSYKTIKARFEDRSNRRIETPEEVMYQIYLKEMAKEPARRSEDLILRCLTACEVMTNPEAYLKHFGKTREEYERL